jgi:hypothetical protein
MIEKEMVKEFQCPGCVNGPYEECYERRKEGTSFRCAKHCPGTIMSGVRTIVLGLPIGFNRGGFKCIRLYAEMPPSIWNYLNVPVWAMEHEGCLFVKTYSPRINSIYIDVIKGGKISDITCNADPAIGKSRDNDFKPINVSEFINEID